ncbi:MAG TPA: hypothetical protein VGL66_15195 [Caulobacteraceae bacterium]|jgi:hypothetical protein
MEPFFYRHNSTESEDRQALSIEPHADERRVPSHAARGAASSLSDACVRELLAEPDLSVEEVEAVRTAARLFAKVVFDANVDREDQLGQ